VTAGRIVWNARIVPAAHGRPGGACYRPAVTANVFGLRLLSQPRVRLAVLVILVIVVLAFRALQFAALTGQVQWGYDFSWYWTAAGHLLHGEPIYSAAQLAGPYAPQGQEGFLYPPPLAAAFMPLAALFPTDYRAAAWVWAGIGALVLVASVLALARSERLAERFPILEGRGRWLLVAGALAFPPVVGELVMGNVHLLLLGLLTLAWLGIRREDAAGAVVAGAAVGIAAVVKVFPGALLLWFLLTRRYRAALGFAIGAGALILVTLPITGVEAWRQFPTVLANLSAPSDTTDTLAPTVWLAPYVGFLGARIVVTTAAVLLLVGVSIAARHDLPSARPAMVARSFAAAIVLSVLVAPALYQHYLALLVLPFMLALGAGVRLRYLALAYFLMWGGDQPAFGDLSWVLNRALPTAGALVLLAALMLPIRHVTGKDITQSAAPA
jgi:alpha-1,2-mannosyltransferase